MGRFYAQDNYSHEFPFFFAMCLFFVVGSHFASSNDFVMIMTCYSVSIFFFMEVMANIPTKESNCLLLNFLIMEEKRRTHRCSCHRFGAYVGNFVLVFLVPFQRANPGYRQEPRCN